MTTIDAERAGAMEVRRAISTTRRADVVALLGAAAAALGLTSLLFQRIAPWSGVVGFVTVSYLLFLVCYALLVSFDGTALTVRDRLASAVVHSLAFASLIALAFIIVFTFWRGHNALGHLNFYTDDMSRAGSLDPLAKGGVLHAVVGTLEEIAIALLVTVPLGLACAVFLNETRGAFTRFVRTIVEAMTALPSIVAGLFIYAALTLGLGVPRSGFAAGMAISVMMLPIVIRAADVVLRLVPSSLKEASYALGSDQLRTVWHVVLPTARSGLTTAVLLGAARGLGETSPVLITAGYGANFNLDPMSGPMVSLPLLTFTLVRFPEPTMIARGFGAAAVLLAVVLVLFLLARLAAARNPSTRTSRRRPRRTPAPVPNPSPARGSS